MNRAQLLRKRKHKKRLIKLNLAKNPTIMNITNASPVDVLSLAYAVAVYWDNDLDCFVAELAYFNGVQIHAPSWDAAATAAKITHQLLITAYRNYGYELPEV